jgi:O-succinylbenzoic acid--CoA ligase
MIPTYQNIHPRFRIDGIALDRESLFDLAYCYIKEGFFYQKEVGMFLLEWLDGCATIQLKTSGTTGIPKNITVSKQAMVHSALATADYFNLQPGDKALLCLPARYVAGKMMLVRALIIGLELDVMTSTSNLDGLLPDKKYDFVALVPLQVQQNLNRLQQFKKIIIGGAPVSKLLSDQLQGIGTEIFETYGMTETITHIAAKRVGDDNFKVLPNVTIATDERSCLIINAPAISEAEIKTNDIVELVSSQSFKWIGRFDHVINSGGIKIFPEQLEMKLSNQLTQPFFIAGLPDEKLGHKIALIIEGPPFEISKNYFKHLEKYEQPKVVLFASEFVRTETTKIDIKKTLNSIGF